MNSADVNDPPTAVGGIRTPFGVGGCRKDLNDPPTAVGGIYGKNSQGGRFCFPLSLMEVNGDGATN